MKLVKAPDQWLQKQVKPFNFDEHNAVDIEAAMIEIMDTEGGMGLSANQVALDAQIFVMKPYLLTNKKPFAIINPTIEKVSVNTTDEVEGCLSFPELIIKVKRPKGIVASYLDTAGKECIIELYDIDARCFLHEYDHLHGIEFTDRVSKLRLQRAKKKRDTLRKKIYE